MRRARGEITMRVLRPPLSSSVGAHTSVSDPADQAHRQQGHAEYAQLRWAKRRFNKSVIAHVLVAGLTVSAVDARACFFSFIDHRWNKDTSGIWNPDIYRGMTYALTGAQVGYALWEGAESRFGDTTWKAMDGEIITVASSEVMKYTFSRVRPSSTTDPCEWFKGNGNSSFPSGEAAFAAALVTPYVLEYAREYPATYALLLFPLYVGIGRMKAQAHWQTDVLAGWALGGSAAYFTHERETSLLVQVLPHGFVVGFKKRF